jgi:hypothetical protein
VNCGHRTRAHYDDVIPRYGFGPRVAAVGMLLTGVYHLSRRSNIKGLSGSCSDMWEHREALCTFVDVDGVESPTMWLGTRTRDDDEEQGTRRREPVIFTATEYQLGQARLVVGDVLVLGVDDVAPVRAAPARVIDAHRALLNACG